MPGPGRTRPPKTPPRPPPPRPLPVTRPDTSGQGAGSSGGGGVSGGAPDGNPELLTRGTGPNPEWVMRDFTGGMHVNPNRDAIQEQDCWWIENLQPLASGYLIPIGPVGASTPQAVAESSLPYYVTEVAINGAPFLFAAFPSGNAYIINLATQAWTKIMTNLLNIVGQTYVVNWMGHGAPSSGILIIDPNGYWDYNLTAPNTLTKIGATVGTSIATYAGRVWIGNANTLSFTDINSYNSFAGAGGSATLSDTYLIGGITCLYAINNYLYIFGAVSVDVLSNVTVSAGVTSFSRVNALQGLGVTYLNVMTVIGYGRGVGFLDVTGYYLLAGATPERISDHIQAVIRNTDMIGGHVRCSVALANINAELCLLLQLAVIPDTFSYTTAFGPNNRSIIFIYQRKRWWCYSTTFGNNLQQGPITGTPNFASTWGAYSIVPTSSGHWATLALPNGTTGGATTSPLLPFNPNWQLRTKLWDGGAAFREKQAMNVGFQAKWYNGGPIVSPGVNFTIDSEFGSSAAFALPNLGAIFFSGIAPATPFGFPGAYALDVYRGAGALQQQYGSQFIGLTFYGDAVNLNIIEGIALRGKQERNMLE